MSAAVSMTLGTFTAKRPAPVSSDPAAMSWLLRATVASSCSALTWYASSLVGATTTSSSSSRWPRNSASSTAGTASMSSRSDWAAL